MAKLVDITLYKTGSPLYGYFSNPFNDMPLLCCKDTCKLFALPAATHTVQLRAYTHPIQGSRRIMVSPVGTICMKFRGRWATLGTTPELSGVWRELGAPRALYVTITPVELTP